MKRIKLFEEFVQPVNEIGDASAKPFSWKPSTDVKKKMKALYNNVQKIGNGKHLTQTFTYTFKNDEGVEYTAYFNGWMQHKTAISFGGPVSPLQRYDSSFNFGYNLTSDYKKNVERETNMGEQFKVMSTVIEIAIDFMRNAEDSGYPVKTLVFTGKGDDGGEGGMDTRRGRMYMTFLQKQLKNLGTKTPYTAMPYTVDGIQGVKLEWGDWTGPATIAKSNESVDESLTGILTALATVGVGVLLRYYADAIVDGLHDIYKTVKAYIAPTEWDKVIAAVGKDEALNKKVLQMIENKEFRIVHRQKRATLIEELPEFKAFVEKNGIDERVARSIAAQMERTIWSHEKWITDKIKKKFDIKEAFEYGDHLLTDPDGVQFKDRLKALKLPAEPNTYDEQRFIEMLKDWFNHEQAESALGSILWELVPLKKKFPKILDPSKGRNLYEGKELYRGTMLPLSKVLALKGQWKKYTGVGLYGEAIEMDVKFKFDFKGDKGFTSFTPASETAEEFADSVSYEHFKPFRPGYSITKRLGEGSTNGMIPVIIKIKDTHPKALFNPQFTTSISPFLDEWEIFLVGYSAEVDGIIIPRWDDYVHASIDLGVDLSKYFNIK